MPTQLAPRLAAAALTASLIGALAGCRTPAVHANQDHPGFGFRVPYSGPDIIDDLQVAFDVENRDGSVKVLVDPKYRVGSVEARPRRRVGTTAEEWRAIEAAPWASAEHILDAEGRSIVRVTANQQADGGPPTPIDIIIRTPVSSGVFIRNQGGSVGVTGGTGALTIHNGFAGGPAGDVIVRTNEALADPIDLRTESGDVLLYTAADLSGDFELLAPNGRTVFEAAVGRPVSSSPAERNHRGNLNGGVDPIRLVSADGNVGLYVVNDPIFYVADTLY